MYGNVHAQNARISRPIQKLTSKQNWQIMCHWGELRTQFIMQITDAALVIAETLI